MTQVVHNQPGAYATVELLRQCRDSGQMSDAQVYEHEQAGDFDQPTEPPPVH